MTSPLVIDAALLLAPPWMGHGKVPRGRTASRSLRTRQLQLSGAPPRWRSSAELGVFFHSNRPLLLNNSQSLVAVQGWQPFDLQESLRRFKRADGASHPYHARFGVAQSAKYDFFFSAVARAKTPPPYLLADTDVCHHGSGTTRIRPRPAPPVETHRNVPGCDAHTLCAHTRARCVTDAVPVHGG